MASALLFQKEGGKAGFMRGALCLYSLDHLVLTVKDLERSLHFYSDILGCPVSRFGKDRFAVLIGQSKINFHQSASPIKPHAANPTCGSADFCLLSHLPMAEIRQFLTARSIPIELGPVVRTGANGTILSVYIRDPDSNLVEIATPNVD